MIVTLPWPDRRLSPNARVHFQQRAKVAKLARDDAIIETCSQMPVQVRQAIAHGDDRLHLTLTFCPPDRRRRDLDNMLASAKALLDGYAHALNVDDHRFDLTLRRGEPVKRGCVEIAV